MLETILRTLAVFFVGGFAIKVIGSAASIGVTVAGVGTYAILKNRITQRVAPIISSTVMLALYIGWALLTWEIHDWLAAEGVANRWLLLFFALTIALAPYHWAQQSERESATAPDPSFASAIAFAGGLQSALVFLMMISGFWVNWWPHLPG